MTAQETTSPEATLESSKAIAAHLKRDVRTAKRWERSEGLPVQRHLHRARSSVYAYPSELDAWWAARSPRLTPAAPARPSRMASRLGLAAALLFTLATSRSGLPNVVGAAGQEAGPALTEIFTGPLGAGFDIPARFSPDGKRLAATDNGYLVVVDVESGKKTRIAPVANGAAELHERYQLFVVSSAGGGLKRVQLPDGHKPWRVRWTADGKVGYISFAARSQFLRLSNFLPKGE